MDLNDDVKPDISYQEVYKLNYLDHRIGDYQTWEYKETKLKVNNVFYTQIIIQKDEYLLKL